MNIQEVRVGNLIEWAEFASMGKGISEVTFENIGYSFLFNPIPLTEEWLIKFGFEQSKVILHIRYSKKNISLITRTDSNVIYFQDLKITSVHQLQNLYFALCGEELTITT